MIRILKPIFSILIRIYHLAICIAIIYFSSMYKLKDLPRSEKPRERLLDVGPAALSDSELLAIVLSSGGKGRNVLLLARELISQFGNLKDLFDASFEDLIKVKNIGVVKASVIKAIYELAFRFNEVEATISDPITSPEQVFRYTKKTFFGKKQEVVAVIALDTRGRATSVEVLSMGTLSSAVIDPRGIFSHALRKGAASIILVHNHPSGDPSPSTEDIEITYQLIEAGKILGVSLVDHVIVTGESFVSMKAINLLGKRG